MFSIKEHAFALSADDILLLPRKGVVSSRQEIKDTDNFIFSAPMDTVTGPELTEAMILNNQVPVVCRFLLESDLEFLLTKYWEKAFFAVGLNDIAKISRLIEKNNIPHVNIAIDIAHGDMDTAYHVIYKAKQSGMFKHIMSGSIVTEAAAERSVEAGCDYLRVGIGPGKACSTRIMTGVGRPQLDAVDAICNSVSEYVKVIADGGISNPGSAVKYLAAGAHGIMMGSEFSRAKESLGWKMDQYGVMKKQYRGQASKAFQKDINKTTIYEEGITCDAIYYDHNLTTQSVIDKYISGVQSACSYLGLSSVKELRERYHQYRLVSYAGYIEGLPKS